MMVTTKSYELSNGFALMSENEIMEINGGSGCIEVTDATIDAGPVHFSPVTGDGSVEIGYDGYGVTVDFHVKSPEEREKTQEKPTAPRQEPSDCGVHNLVNHGSSSHKSSKSK